MEKANSASGSKILFYFETERLPPSDRFKNLLVEVVVGQITPAEPYKNTVLTIFEMALPVRGDYTSVLPNTNDYVTFFTRYIELPSYYLHLEPYRECQT